MSLKKTKNNKLMKNISTILSLLIACLASHLLGLYAASINFNIKPISTFKWIMVSFILVVSLAQILNDIFKKH